MSQDAISVEVFANLFKAVVDEMAWIVLRSSHTTFVKETQDFAVSLVTPEGEIFAYPYGSMDASAELAVKKAGYDYACSVATPKVDLGIMALPRVTISQRDGSARMAAKKTFFNEYTVAKGTLITLSNSPVVQGVKRPLSAIARLPVRKGGKRLPA